MPLTVAQNYNDKRSTERRIELGWVYILTDGASGGEVSIEIRTPNGFLLHGNRAEMTKLAEAINLMVANTTDLQR